MLIYHIYYSVREIDIYLYMSSIVKLGISTQALLKVTPFKLVVTLEKSTDISFILPTIFITFINFSKVTDSLPWIIFPLLSPSVQAEFPYSSLLSTYLLVTNSLSLNVVWFVTIFVSVKS